MPSQRPDATFRVRCDCSMSTHFIEVDHWRWKEGWDNDLMVSLCTTQASSRWKRLKEIWKYFWSGESIVVGDIVIDLEEADRLGQWLILRAMAKSAEDVAAVEPVE